MVQFADLNGQSGDQDNVVGNITITSSSTAYNTSSDYRLKENTVDITDGISRLKELKPYRFNFIRDPNTIVDGFFAHEVSSLVPEAVCGEKDAVDEEGKPDYQGIDQSKLVPLLTAALQEAVTKIEALEARVASLGGISMSDLITLNTPSIPMDAADEIANAFGLGAICSPK